MLHESAVENSTARLSWTYDPISHGPRTDVDLLLLQSVLNYVYAYTFDMCTNKVYLLTYLN